MELAKGHRRPSMCTYTGVEFFPLDPEPGKVWLADVAHHLSMTCRYRGATRWFYSVAEHSVEVSARAQALPHEGRDWRMVGTWGLLHDAAEAYLCDMVSPLKRCLPEFVEYEERVTRAVAERFGLPWPPPFEVMQADRDVFAGELAAGVMPRPDWWVQPGPPNDWCASPGFTHKGPEAAESAFLVEAEYLLGPDRYWALLAPPEFARANRA